MIPKNKFRCFRCDKVFPESQGDFIKYMGTSKVCKDCQIKLLERKIKKMAGF